MWPGRSCDRGAADPGANAALFDFGILANVPHASVIIPQAFYPGEHADLWTDVPLLLAVSLVLWLCHPGRQRRACESEPSAYSAAIAVGAARAERSTMRPGKAPVGRPPRWMTWPLTTVAR